MNRVHNLHQHASKAATMHDNLLLGIVLVLSSSEDRCNFCVCASVVFFEHTDCFCHSRVVTY
eukprot:6245909-Amphidinium_carterae.1